MKPQRIGIGSRVRSPRVGVRPAFVGTIVGKVYEHWIVQDDAGKEWLRIDLKAVEDDATGAQSSAKCPE